MVKLKGPLGSQTASGSIGDAVTFSSNKGRAYARTKVDTPNPDTPPQVSRRALWTFLAKAWFAISDPNKATWTPLAQKQSISEFNAYLAYNSANWLNYLPPSKTYPAARVLPSSDRQFALIEWVEHQVRLRTTAATANSQWGLIIHQDYPIDYTATIDTPIIFELDEDLATHNTLWTYKEKIPLRFKTQPFSIDGWLSPITSPYTLWV